MPTAAGDQAIATRVGVPLIDRPGVVAVVSGARGTFPEFAIHFAALEKPPRATTRWILSGAGDVAMARNDLVEAAIAYAKGEPYWVFFLDDDHVFSSDMLMRLLAHDQLIVVPMVMCRRDLDQWLAWEMFPVRGDMSDYELQETVATHAKFRDSLQAEEATRLVEVGLAGCSGMLIASEVLNAMEKPWFQFGRLGSWSAGEDTWFALKARRYGGNIYCDPQTRMGHLFTSAVWPKVDQGKVVGAVDTKVTARVRYGPVRIVNKDASSVKSI